ncbi:MAG: NapC/NirT family cytochrome c [Anaerolineales bacterium]|nr:NapC/NirT family cytochrome c [Anaerolineales bacterium]
MKRRKLLLIGGIAAVIILIASMAGWHYHEQPSFCATCHNMESYVESWKSSTFSVHSHAMEGVNCLECHEPSIQQQVDELVKFVKNDYENPMEERQFSQDFCLRCHEHESVEEVIARTEDYEVNGEAVNPHDPHADVDIEALAEEPLECSECHKMHRESPQLKSCYTCHHMYTFQSCSSWECHAGQIPIEFE